MNKMVVEEFKIDIDIAEIEKQTIAFTLDFLTSQCKKVVVPKQELCLFDIEHVVEDSLLKVAMNIFYKMRRVTKSHVLGCSDVDKVYSILDGLMYVINRNIIAELCYLEYHKMLITRYRKLEEENDNWFE